MHAELSFPNSSYMWTVQDTIISNLPSEILLPDAHGYGAGSMHTS